jgi:hypothetical protein
MDDSNITISSLTSEPDDLTLIHAQSGLPITYNNRRTEEGFLIKESRLPNYVPLPATK